MSAVAGHPSRYWVITGDVVSLMSQTEMDAVDAAILDANREATASRMENVEDIIRALALTTLDDLNLHAARITAILDAIDQNSTLATIKTAIAAIPDIPQRTGAQLKTAVRNKLGT
jgi:1,6-anhydro-N-acetylmuramate kinase